MLTSLFSLLLVFTGVTNKERLTTLLIEARASLAEAWREIFVIAWACFFALPFALGRWAPILEPLRFPGLAAAAILLAVFVGRARGPHFTRAADLRLYFLHVSLLALSVVLFFLPLQLMRFDTGTDLSVMLGIDQLWFEPWATLNRPFAGLAAYLALALTPNSLWGFFIVISVLRFGTAWAIYDIVRNLMPSRSYLGFISAFLFIVFPSEPGRYDLWSIIYYGGVFLLSVGIALLVKSYKSGKRLTLLTGITCLVFSLLHYETGFPIAAFAPVLLLFLPLHPRFFVWLACWWGALGLLALRILLYFLKPGDVYQTFLYKNYGYVPDTLPGWVSMVASNATVQLAPLVDFIPRSSSSLLAGNFAPVFLLSFAAATLVLIIASWKSRPLEASPRRSVLLPVMVAMIFVVLGILPFLPLPVTTGVPDYGQHPTARYQFFATPGEGAFWGLAIGAIAVLLGARLQKIFLVAAPATLIALASTHAFAFQKSGGFINPKISLERSASNWRDIDRIVASEKPDAMFFELDGDNTSPIGWNYTVLHYSCVLFGKPSAQGTLVGNEFKTRVFARPDSVVLPTELCGKVAHVKVGLDGRATLLGIIEGKGSNACSKCVVNQRPRAPGEPLPFFAPGLSPYESSRH